MCVNVCKCLHIWRLEVDVGVFRYHSQPFFFFEMGFHNVALTGLKVVMWTSVGFRLKKISQPVPPGYWDSRPAPLGPATSPFERGPSH